MNKKIKDKQQKPVFQPPKGDMLDQMLSHYINQANCPVPIRKLGNGFYLFGTKRIFAKILNGKLVIRVGGGFMIIEEFIATYADAEMNKIAKMSDQQLMALGADSQEISTSVNPNARLSLYRTSAANFKQRGSPTANVQGRLEGSKMNGTQRTKSVRADLMK
uniref:GAR domain-containing protein n=1 Tax=Strombidium rassoulzadegani TaxID=1082188 RepID=A0A7S3FSI4_9SPIT|mmetsp:Transcript_10644/g.17886  ORF Transcript_10644/g.17886 Transcript_10644/m.17886 type:complete len:162 (+) Transcript_10644:940-1425(+)